MTSCLGEATEGYTIDQMTKLISRYRNETFGDWYTLIHIAPLCYADDTDSRFFIRFCNRIIVDGKSEVMIGWANPALLLLASRSDLNLFLDCTFSICPSDFTQCLILMLFDETTNLYIPFFYVLLQSKHEATYNEALHQIKFATNYKINAKSITCDFEMGLYNALQHHFPNAVPVLCLFHFKQALRRWFQKKVCSYDDLANLIGPTGFINILCVIDPETIITTGY
jgi:hypothetical protein